MAGTEDLERRTHAQAPRRRRLAAAVAIALSASVLMSGCRIEAGVGTVGHHRAAVAGAAPRLTVTTEPPPSTTTTAQPTTTTEPPSTTTARPRPRYTTTTLDLWLNPRWPVEPPDVETTVFWLVLDETPLAYSLYLDAHELAHTTCDTLDAGVPLDVLVVEMVLLVDPQFLDLTSSVMGAGIGAFCPWHNSQVRGL